MAAQRVDPQVSDAARASWRLSRRRRMAPMRRTVWSSGRACLLSIVWADPVSHLMGGPVDLSAKKAKHGEFLKKFVLWPTVLQRLRLCLVRRAALVPFGFDE